MPLSFCLTAVSFYYRPFFTGMIPRSLPCHVIFCASTLSQRTEEEQIGRHFRRLVRKMIYKAPRKNWMAQSDFSSSYMARSLKTGIREKRVLTFSKLNSVCCERTWRSGNTCPHLRTLVSFAYKTKSRVLSWALTITRARYEERSFAIPWFLLRIITVSNNNGDQSQVTVRIITA